MGLANEKNMCEGIEIALLSDTELTDKQKNHIKDCQSCKALLSQAERLKSELGMLSVPGISEGQIADAVMKSIRTERSLPAVKFKWTHHIGTIAAAVIILVTAHIIKNPLNESNSGNGNTITVNDNYTSDKSVSGTEEQAYVSLQDTVSQENAIEETQESSDILQGKIRNKAFATPTEQNTYSDTYVNQEGQELQVASEESDKSNEPVLVLHCSESDSLSYDTAGTSQNTEQSTDQNDFGMLSGTSISSVESENEQAEAAGGSGASTQILPFADIDFLDGEENFDANIEKLNVVLSEKYPEYKLTKELLIKFNCDTNEKFVEKAKSMTDIELKMIITMVRANTKAN